MEIEYTFNSRIKDSFSKEGVVVLHTFFSEGFLEHLKNRVTKLKWKKEFELLHHSYHMAEVNVNSKELLAFLSGITNKKIRNLQCTVLKLTWKDYSILNDAFIEKPGRDVIIDLTANWNGKWGGLVTYADGSGNYVEIPAMENSLAIVQRKTGMNRFIQYLNHYGKGKERIVLIGKI